MLAPPVTHKETICSLMPGTDGDGKVRGRDCTKEGDSDVIVFHIWVPLDFCRHLVGKNSEKYLSL